MPFGISPINPRKSVCTYTAAPLGLAGLDKTTNPPGLKEKEVVIFLGHFVPSDLTPENREQAAGIQEDDEIRNALDRMKGNTDAVPDDAFISVVGCFQPAAEKYVGKLFPDTWLDGPGYIKEDRLTTGKEDVPIAIEVFRTAVGKGPRFTISVYADKEFREALAGALPGLSKVDQAVVRQILIYASRPRR
jgi:hypothetical protein